MAKVPDDRFDSCGELANAARNAASGKARRVEGTAPARADTVASADTAPPASPPAPGSDSAFERRPCVRAGASCHLGTESCATLPADAAEAVAADFAPGRHRRCSVGRCRLLPCARRRQDGAPDRRPRACHPHSRRPRSRAGLANLHEHEDTARRRRRDRDVPATAGATTFNPDRLELSTFASGAAVQRAYEAERRRHRVPRNRGRCTG